LWLLLSLPVQLLLFNAARGRGVQLGTAVDYSCALFFRWKDHHITLYLHNILVVRIVYLYILKSPSRYAIWIFLIYVWISKGEKMASTRLQCCFHAGFFKIKSSLHPM
jgi:hypothetical protein